MVHGSGIRPPPRVPASPSPSIAATLPRRPTARSCASRFVALATSSSTSSAKSGGKSTLARLRSSWRYAMRSVWTFMRRAAASSRSSMDIGSVCGRDLASLSMSASRVSLSAAASAPASQRSLPRSSSTGSSATWSVSDAWDGVSRPAAIWRRNASICASSASSSRSSSSSESEERGAGTDGESASAPPPAKRRSSSSSSLPSLPSPSVSLRMEAPRRGGRRGGSSGIETSGTPRFPAAPARARV